MAGEQSSGPAARKESIYDAFVSASGRTAHFDATASALRGRVGFIVGAPRSGTTWLQQLLFVHPLVATGGESHLFCEGVPEIFENFAHPNGMSHLSTWVSRAELLGAARAFCDRVFMAQRDGTRPDAQLILEKTPNHRLQSALQAELYPDARYVHIVRDGRDATASQRKLWGERTDEFSDAGRAAEAWAAAVRDIRAHFGALAFLELRYEDIVDDTPAALARIFDHLGLPHDAALCAAAAAFGRAPVHTSPASPHVGIRKHAGDVLAERAVARAAGDLLVELGYADAAEVEQMRSARSPATVVADARAGMRRVLGLAKRRRPRRIAAGPARGVASAIASAIAESNRAALQKLVAPGASAAAAEVLTRFGGSRLVQRRVLDDAALLTFVTPNGDRAVVRVTMRDGVASGIETL